MSAIVKQIRAAAISDLAAVVDAIWEAKHGYSRTDFLDAYHEAMEAFENCELPDTGKDEIATVQPSITGEQAGLWIFGTILLHNFDDVTASQVAAMNINAAFKEWMTTTPVNEGAA